METKEKIKDRILKQAARVWGYTDQEFESSFDPVVALLLEAVASELQKLSNELDNSQSRIVERLLDITTPEVFSAAKPSHAILHAQPLEESYELKYENQFYSKKSMPNVYDPTNPIIKTLYFGPTAKFQLYDLPLTHVAFGKSLYSVEQSFHKHKLLSSTESLANSTLYLGFNAKNFRGKIEDFMLYASVVNQQFQDMFYHYLKQMEIKLNGKPLRYKEAYPFEIEEFDIKDFVGNNYNEMSRIYREINEFYSSKFISILDEIEVEDDTLVVPEDLQKVIDKATGERVNFKETLWLELTFPETMLGDVIESSIFVNNCFPVVNKEYHESIKAMNPYVNYVPLESEYNFLGLQAITDTFNNQYHLKDFSDEELGAGNASLRHKGVIRFDERDASEVIQYLMELLKDESASFSLLGGDFVDHNLKKLNQIIATIEQQTKEQQFTQKSFPYVIVVPAFQIEQGSKESIIASYWSCAGADGNDLKPQTKLSDRNSIFKPTEIYLMTGTVGGQDRLDTKDKIFQYRKALLTHNRIVTRADIRAFCKEHLKHAISDLDIKNGTRVNQSDKMGFERTIDIILYRNDHENPISKKDWDYLTESLLTKLNSASSNIFPYRIIVQEHENQLL